MKKQFAIKDMEKELFKTSKAKKLYEKEVNLLRIAHQIAELRENHNMSQKELAMRLQTKQQVISRIEKYDYRPSITTLEKIAEIFHKKLLVKFV